jgi:hypothetical protein
MNKWLKLFRTAFLGPFCLMMSAAAGPVYSDAIDTTRKELDVTAKIARLAPESSIFTTILLEISKETTSQDTINWYEQDPTVVWTPSRGGNNSSVTTWPVDDASIFTAKDIIAVVSLAGLVLETAVVTAVDLTENTNTVTVAARAWTGTAQTIADNQYLCNLGPAMEENSTAPGTRVHQPTLVSNYVQELRLPFDASLLANQALRSSETERQRLTTDKGIEFKRMIERTCIAGKKKNDTANRKKAMGGILEMVTENYWAAGGIVTEKAFIDNFCEPLFAYDKENALFVCGPKWPSIMAGWSIGKLQTTSKEETYGMQLQYYQSPHGKLVLAPSLELAGGSWTGMGIGLHMKRLRLKFFKDGSKTYNIKLDRNIQENDRHGWKDEYWAMPTLELQNQKTHAVVTGATG